MQDTYLSKGYFARVKQIELFLKKFILKKSFEHVTNEEKACQGKGNSSLKGK